MCRRRQKSNKILENEITSITKKTMKVESVTPYFTIHQNTTYRSVYISGEQYCFFDRMVRIKRAEEDMKFFGWKPLETSRKAQEMIKETGAMVECQHCQHKYQRSVWYVCPRCGHEWDDHSKDGKCTDPDCDICKKIEICKTLLGRNKL